MSQIIPFDLSESTFHNYWARILVDYGFCEQYNTHAIYSKKSGTWKMLTTNKNGGHTISSTYVSGDFLKKFRRDTLLARKKKLAKALNLTLFKDGCFSCLAFMQSDHISTAKDVLSNLTLFAYNEKSNTWDILHRALGAPSWYYKGCYYTGEMLLRLVQDSVGTATTAITSEAETKVLPTHGPYIIYSREQLKSHMFKESTTLIDAAAILRKRNIDLSVGVWYIHFVNSNKISELKKLVSFTF